jgi:hypothetical protein
MDLLAPPLPSHSRNNRVYLETLELQGEGILEASPMADSWRRKPSVKGNVFRKIHRGFRFCRLRGLCPDGSKILVKSPTIRGLYYVMCGYKEQLCNQQSLYQKTIDLRKKVCH